MLTVDDAPGLHNLSGVKLPFCYWCDGCIYEAWERMTYGGVYRIDDRTMVPFVTTIFNSGHIHTEYWSYAAR